MCERNRRRAEAAVRDLQQEAQGLSEAQVAARVLELSVRTSRPLVRELAALPPPQGRERQAGRFVQLLRQTFPLFQRNARALRAGDRETVERTNDRLLEIGGESRRLARELDIAACLPRQGN